MLAIRPLSADARSLPMPDTQVVEVIRARYERDPRLQHAAELAVSERAGTVTLRGTVRSLHQRRVAVDIAKAVRGVRAVEDELLVDPRDRWLDDEIRGAALQALMSSPDVPADMIDVRVADTWLTLSGQVKHQADSNAAFEAVSGLPRVGGITNKIQVITAGGY
jgi:osmotically-inducible protein OsmY